MTSIEKDNSIASAVLETAQGLYDLGFIDQRKMRKYELLCEEPIPAYTSEKIRKLRDKYQLSQTVFATLLNISPSTVRQWEQGDKTPGGTSAKLLYILESKGIESLL